MRRVLLAVAVTTTFLAVAAPAQAACPAQELEQPFLRFLDPMHYTLAPGGSFEAGAPGWQLKGGAKIVSGNETFYVGGKSDANSLYLPSGSSATTPAICVGIEYPTLRFFAANRGSILLSTLKVDVLVAGLPVPIGLALGGSAWQPTLPMLVVKNLLAPLASDGSVDVRFRFTPVGLGAKWQIDDVYVDPFKSR